MKTDMYTKIVLTVIAISLVTIVIRDINFVSTASANTVSEITALDIEQQKAGKVNEKDKKKDNRKIIDVNIVQVNGKDIGYNEVDGQFPVYITNKHVPVYFKGIPYVKVSNHYDFKEDGGIIGGEVPELNGLE